MTLARAGRDGKRDDLIPPYGGRLINLVVADNARSELALYARTLPAIQLSSRSLYDLELLAVGAFSPLDRFMGKADYVGVLEEMRLSNGILFPITITLPIAETDSVQSGKEIALVSPS